MALKMLVTRASLLVNKIRAANTIRITTFIVLGACQGDGASIVPPGDPATFYQQLTVNYPAVNLSLVSPYDTVRLSAVVKFGNGETLRVTPKYLPNDSTVTVDTSGLVTARYVTETPALIRVMYTLGDVTRREVVQVRIIATPPPAAISGLSIQPARDSQARTALSQSHQLRVYVYDASNDSVPETLISLRSSDPSIIRVSEPATGSPFGRVHANRPGSAIIFASTFAYGVALNDSLVFSTGEPIRATYVAIDIDSAQPTKASLRLTATDTIRLGRGGYVLWQNMTNKLMDVVFDIPEAARMGNALQDLGDLDDYPGDGNISPFVGSLFNDGGLVYRIGYRALRAFPAAGIFSWHSTLQPISGVIVVCDERAGPCK